MRTKYKLYQIVLAKYKERLAEHSMGLICCTIQNCYLDKLITNDEFNFIITDFIENKPNYELHKEFMVNGLWSGGLIWWKAYSNEKNASANIRVKFLEKLIEINLVD